MRSAHGKLDMDPTRQGVQKVPDSRGERPGHPKTLCLFRYKPFLPPRLTLPRLASCSRRRLASLVARVCRSRRRRRRRRLEAAPSPCTPAPKVGILSSSCSHCFPISPHRADEGGYYVLLAYWQSRIGLRIGGRVFGG